MREGIAFDDGHDVDALQIASVRTFDPELIWNNPNMKIPLESAHLRKSKEDDPQMFEKLCVEHEAIKQTNNEA